MKTKKKACKTRLNEAGRTNRAINGLIATIPDLVWEEHLDRVCNDKLPVSYVSVKYIDALRGTHTKSGYDYPTYLQLSHVSRLLLTKQILVDMIPPRFGSPSVGKMESEEGKLTVRACEGAANYIEKLKARRDRALLQKARTAKKSKARSVTETKKANAKIKKANEGEKSKGHSRDGQER